MAETTTSRRSAVNPVRVAIIAVLAAFAAASFVYASAASLGGLGSATVYASDTAVSISIPPPPDTAYVSDDFNVTEPTDLDGYVSDTGQTWTVLNGGFQVTPSGAVSGNAKPWSWAAVDTFHSNQLSGSVDLSGMDRRHNGMALSSNGTDSFLAVVYNFDNGRLGLWKSVNGTLTLLALSDVAPGIANTTIIVEIDQPTITAYGVGTSLTYQMTPAEQASFGTWTYWGLVSGTNQVVFDNFRVEPL